MDNQPTTPTEPVVPAETSATPETPAEQPEQNTATVLTPEQQFVEDYKAFCKEKGFELAFEVKPQFDKTTGVYDLTKVTVSYSVAKVK